MENFDGETVELYYIISKYHVIYPNTARSFEDNHGFIASNDANQQYLHGS